MIALSDGRSATYQYVPQCAGRVLGRADSILSAMAVAAGRKLLIVGRKEMVSRIFASWNQLDGWLRQVDALRRAA